MSWIQWLLVGLGLSLVTFILFLAIIFWLLYRLVKTSPKVALFILLIFFSIGLAGSFNPVTFTPALIMLVGAVGVMALQYKKLKKSLR